MLVNVAGQNDKSQTTNNNRSGVCATTTTHDEEGGGHFAHDTKNSTTYIPSWRMSEVITYNTTQYNTIQYWVAVSRLDLNVPLSIK